MVLSATILHYSAMVKRGPYRKTPSGHVGRSPALKLRKWREFYGWTQDDLAERAGMSVGTISGLERGEVGFSDESLAKLAKALGCSIGALFDVDPTNEGGTTLWHTWAEMTVEQRQLLARIARDIKGPSPSRK